jgi:hypothetical protein
LGKLFSKVLATRLALRLDNLVHGNQSVFIKGRFIQDNFHFVQASTNVHKHPSLLLKVDISRAFDSVSWTILLEVMLKIGFPRKWLNWISVLLSTTSTRVLLNGSLGQLICHARGLWQGDPLPSMLFLLLMEVLSAMIRKADDWHIYQQLGVRAIPYQASLYADDLVLFVSPNPKDLQLTHYIFSLFEGASRLGCNFNKCQVAAIHCDEGQVALATSIFPCQVISFPVKYHGMPLSVTKLPKSTWQPLVDRMADRLLAWRGQRLHHSGQLTLIKMTLTTTPVYTMISIELPPWLLKTMERIMKTFLGTGTDKVKNGKCLVAWS